MSEWLNEAATEANFIKNANLQRSNRNNNKSGLVFIYPFLILKANRSHPVRHTTQHFFLEFPTDHSLSNLLSCIAQVHADKLYNCTSFYIIPFRVVYVILIHLLGTLDSQHYCRIILSANLWMTSQWRWACILIKNSRIQITFIQLKQTFLKSLKYVSIKQPLNGTVNIIAQLSLTVCG